MWVGCEWKDKRCCGGLTNTLRFGDSKPTEYLYCFFLGLVSFSKAFATSSKSSLSSSERASESSCWLGLARDEEAAPSGLAGFGVDASSVCTSLLRNAIKGDAPSEASESSGGHCGAAVNLSTALSADATPFSESGMLDMLSSKSFMLISGSSRWWADMVIPSTDVQSEIVIPLTDVLWYRRLMCNPRLWLLIFVGCADVVMVGLWQIWFVSEWGWGSGVESRLYRCGQRIIIWKKNVDLTFVHEYSFASSLSSTKYWSIFLVECCRWKVLPNVDLWKERLEWISKNFQGHSFILQISKGTELSPKEWESKNSLPFAEKVFGVYSFELNSLKAASKIFNFWKTTVLHL